jgi:GGDEF domain-containing protein
MSIDSSTNNVVPIVFGDPLQQLRGIEVRYISIGENIFDEPNQVCIINLPAVEQDELLTRIHSSPVGWSWRIYTHQTSSLSQFLTDGLLTEDRPLTPFGKLNYLKNKPKDRLLAYLWLDENRSIEPSRDLTRKEIYRYPILDIYHNQESTPFKYLHSLNEQALLEKTDCVDRVRYCQVCQSGHLNYVDSCPSCSSIDIRSYEALHCFTCGHVDDEKEFLKRNSMQCPNCAAVLKHIGVDYDRPLEMHGCNHCKQEFVEATVVAKCLSCDHTNEVNNLKSQAYFVYKSGENAQRFLMDEQFISQYDVKLSGTVSSTIFEATLDWKNKLSERHGHTDLLLGIKLKNANSFKETQGDVAYIEFIAQLTEQLENLLRETDLSCQYHDEVLFVLLPHFDFDFINSIQDRMLELAQLIENDIIELVVRKWTLPDSQLTNSPVWLRNCVSQLND